MMKIGVSHYKDLKGNFYVNGGVYSFVMTR